MWQIKNWTLGSVSFWTILVLGLYRNLVFISYMCFLSFCCIYEANMAYNNKILLIIIMFHLIIWLNITFTWEESQRLF